MPLYDEAPSTLDYDLHNQAMILLVEKRGEDGYYQPRSVLPGYTLAEADTDEASEITIPVPELRDGKVLAFIKTVQTSYVRRYTHEVGFPPGRWLRTPLGYLVKNLSNCSATFYLVNLCPSDYRLGVAFMFDEGMMTALKAGQLLSFNEDGAAIESTASLYYTEPDMVFHIEATQQAAAAQALHTVAFDNKVCQDCDGECQAGIYGGATFLLETTTDGFVTRTDITPTLPVGSIITSLIKEGDKIIGTYTDNIDPATATTGGIFTIVNGVETDLAQGTALYSVIKASGHGYAYLAFGAGGAIYKSRDGINWSTFTQTLSSAHFYQAAYDKKTATTYVAGDNTTTGEAIMIRGNSLIDISANVGAGANGLLSVAILGKDHVMFGDDAGNVYEHVNAAKGTPFQTPATGIADPITFIGGNRQRQIVGGGTNLLRRDPLSDLEFAAVEFVAGQTLTGNIRAGAICTKTAEIFPGINYGVVVTDANEVVTFKPYGLDGII